MFSSLNFSLASSSLIFVESYRCDIESKAAGEFTLAAYCNTSNRNVVLLYHDDDARTNDYYSKSIVHETGHAFDFTIGHENTNDKYYGITEVNSSGTKQVKGLMTYDSSGKAYTWDRLVNEEANYFDSSHSSISTSFDSKEAAKRYYDNYCINGQLESIEQDTDGNWTLTVSYNNTKDPNGVSIDGLNSYYSVDDYVQMPYEYFADSFQAYFLGDQSYSGGKSQLEYLQFSTCKAFVF